MYYTLRVDIDKRKCTILRWEKRLLHAVIGECITCWDKRNSELHGDKAPVSAHIRLQKLRVRVAKAYANDMHLVPLSLSPSSVPPFASGSITALYNSRNGLTLYVWPNRIIPSSRSPTRLKLHTILGAPKFLTYTPTSLTLHFVNNSDLPFRPKQNGSQTISSL